MKKIWLVLLAGLVASSAMAQEADLARPIMTAEEARKLACAWTGFDKNRAADLIPKCRAELVDSGYLKQPQLGRFMSGARIWRVDFDSARIGWREWSDSALKGAPARLISVFIDDNSKRLLAICGHIVGTELSTATIQIDDLLVRYADSALSIPQAIDVQSALSHAWVINSFRWDSFVAACVFGDPGPGKDPQPFWFIKAYPIEHPRGGNGYGTTCVNANTGKGCCGLGISGR